MSFAIPVPAPADLLKPNGVLQFDEGGNPRGANSVDFQRVRSDDVQVAAGIGAFCAGQRNAASGNGAIVIGLDNAVGFPGFPTFGEDTIALGRNNAATIASKSVLIGSDNFEGSSTGMGIAIGEGNFLGGAGPNICIGKNNVCNTGGIVAIGEKCEAAKSQGIAIGSFAKTHTESEFCISHFSFTADSGTAQFSMWHAGRLTTDATANQPLLHNLVTFPQTLTGERTYVGSIDLVAHEVGGSVAAGAWHWEVAFEKRAANVTLHNSTLTYSYNPDSLGAALDDTQSDTLRVNVTGKMSRSFRWLAVYRFSHVSD